ncbi:hypothetical protein GUJ93_ZPchr0010g11206 [Zizania palustris]|uniref:Uncharacterized protein n=1 Tax=Zizania palustris TaxID=103762 RepID=A0A8J5WCV2_ZIZPA|nr:hypothetical protein GUJ93_ZPchr0010g11206 [Zizania palustris]
MAKVTTAKVRIALCSLHVGVDYVKEAKVQTLCWKQENLCMGKESVDDLSSNITILVGRMQSFGEKIENTYVIKKLLRDIAPAWPTPPAHSTAPALASYPTHRAHAQPPQPPLGIPGTASTEALSLPIPSINSWLPSSLHFTMRHIQTTGLPPLLPPLLPLPSTSAATPSPCRPPPRPTTAHCQRSYSPSISPLLHLVG